MMENFEFTNKLKKFVNNFWQALKKILENLKFLRNFIADAEKS